MVSVRRVRLTTDVVRGTTTFAAGTICDVVPGRVSETAPKLLVSIDGRMTVLKAGQYEKAPDADLIKGFLRDIEEVCKQYDISIGHEDGHGRFLLLDYNDPRGGFGEGSFYDRRKKAP